MLYCDYRSYVRMGGLMTEEQYQIWGSRATRKIDQLTMGRAQAHKLYLAGELADACGQMADAMQRQAAARASSASGLLAGASTDGYSERYSAGNSRAAERELYRLLADALGNDSYGLLYAGI